MEKIKSDVLLILYNIYAYILCMLTSDCVKLSFLSQSWVTIICNQLSNRQLELKKNTFIRKIYNHKAMNYNVLVINSLKKSNCLNWF